MGKPSTPTPPNPIATAGAQTGTNVSTAVANAFLNNTNQVTPTGSLDYNQTGTYSWTDPTTGSTYNIPRFTATQTLSPQEQAIQNQTLGAQFNLAGMANAQSGQIAQMLSNPLDVSGAPNAGNAQNIASIPSAATGYNTGGNIQTSLAPTSDIIAHTYGPNDFSADRQQVEDALMQRMNPQLAIEKNSLQQQLADQGIRPGSAAYTNAMDNYNRQSNDARWGAIVQAAGQQQQMVNEAAQQSAFQNAAQQQEFQQGLTSGGFTNAAQAQQNQQNAALAAFGNQGLLQQQNQQQAAFNAAQTARNQYLQEQFALRNQPINEITSLMSGSQVSQPNFLNTPQSQIPTTDVAGLINQNFNQQSQNYNSQLNSWNSMMGGVLGLGAGAMKLSDRREKDDIDRIGTIFAAGNDDAPRHLPIYSYSYKDDPASVTHIGPMAQDVEKVDPRSVKERGGRKYIDQSRLMGNILKAA